MPKTDPNPTSDLSKIEDMSDDMKKGYAGEMNWKKLECQIILKIEKIEFLI